MATEEKECPFCKERSSTIKNFDTLQSTYSDCLCGKFIIDQKVLEDSDEYNKILRTDEDKILFSGYLRNNQTTITEEFISGDLPGILGYCQRKTLSEKISYLKSYIYQETTLLGKSVPIEVGKLYTLFYLKEPKELYSLLRHLQEINILNKNTNVGGATANVLLTVEGFSEIESTLEDHSQSRKVFIACNFDTPYQDDLVKAIKSACAICGFDANLVSGEKHNDDISHKIISDIRRSKFIIADFTDQNNGVYFEAGYAMGMSKKVIRLIDKEQFESLHFDTRQFNHIPWEHGEWEELEDKLIDQINATIK
ncbi:hypothetical protein HOB87_15395 [Candidatus Woesearchaeota archaeon]|jgi:hypothetical protein|nr:hypothetical protein [Candidatus Woesearchaeota archaeon]